MTDQDTAARIAALEAQERELERERAALLESESRLRTILDILPVGVWFTDAVGKIVLGNPAGQRIWGGARWVGLDRYGEYKGWWADTGERIRADEWALARALRGETHLDEVVDIECFDGSRRTILNSGVPVRDAGGAIVGAVVLNVDISEQKRTERTLQQAMERLRFHSDNSPLAVVEWSADFKVVAWNAAAERMFGWTAAEAIGKGMDHLRLVHPEDLPGVVALSAAMASGASPSNVHANRNVRKDGRVLHTEWHNSALLDPAGRLLSVLSLVMDVTARRQAEEERRASEQRATSRAVDLQTVLDTVPAAVWIARDPEGSRIDANRFGAELLLQPVGANVSISGPVDERPMNFRAMKDGVELTTDQLPIQAAARFGKEVHDFDFDLLFEDGRTIHLLGNATPLLDDAGNPRGSVGAFIDVTDRKEAEEAVRVSDRRKSEFLAILSHELRNPLAPIRNSLALLDRAFPGDTAVPRALGVLHRQTRHLTRLVDDLLDMTRISRGKVELQRARLDLRDPVSLACEDLRSLFVQRGIHLDVGRTAEPLWVDADAERLTQIIGNLLNNALKFTPAGGSVRVSTGRRDGECEVRVRDDGMGIDPLELECIFQPFVQGERARKAGHGGLGIGLALVKELAVGHGGDVRATSGGPGKGAEFVVSFPMASPPADAAELPPARPAARRLRILIVEDNLDAGTSLADLLELGGHSVKVVTSGRAGVAAAAAEAPDVLISDIGLPDLSGHDVIRAIRASGSVPPPFAIALTGFAQPNDRAQALEAGFDAHLPKPPPLEALEELLATAAKGKG